MKLVLPRSYIIKEGEIGYAMYFMSNGFAQCFIEGNHISNIIDGIYIIELLAIGDIFGEIALLISS